jgi:lipopolysaccharide biosynthesis glycosyltransferase
MHLWGLTQYKRVLYLDADTMVVGRIDELFALKLPHGAIPNGGSELHAGVLAVHDRFAGIFNSGLMVLQPSKTVISKMLQVYMETDSYNLGDQGFLNVFWKDAAGFLDGKYNYFSWLAHSTWGKSILKERRVMHYTAEVKPWNFLDWQTSTDTFFGNNYIANLWMEWMAVADQVRAAHWYPNDIRFPTMPRNKVCSDPATIKHYTERKFKGKDQQLTVIINLVEQASTNQNLRTIVESVESYANIELVSEIIVCWNKAFGPQPSFAAKINGKPVSVHVRTRQSNPKFFPHLLKTAFFLIANHDIPLNDASLLAMFGAATAYPGRMVGPFAYTINLDEAPAAKAVVFNSNPTYSIIDTRFAIIRTDYLFLYTCMVDTRLHNVVDMVGDCEELLMNIIGNSVSDLPMLHVSLTSAGSGFRQGEGKNNKAHQAALARCAAKFKQILNSVTLNMRNAHGTIRL